MAWIDRIRRAQYVSPANVATIFDFEAINETPEKKSTTYIFGNVEGAYVQDFGRGSRSFEIRAYISGGDYDTRATGFLNSLTEIGSGVFTHPLQGNKTVVPVKVRRADNLVSGAGQAVIDISFVETLNTIFPTPSNSTSDVIQSLIGEFDVLMANGFSNALNIVSSSEISNFKTYFRSVLGGGLSVLSRSMSGEAVREFQVALEGVEVTLASDGFDLSHLASQAISAIRFSEDLQDLGSYTDSLLKTAKTTVDNSDVNEKTVNKLFSYSAIVAMVNATLNKTFENRQSSLIDAEFIARQFERVISWNEDQNKIYSIVAADSAYESFYSLVRQEVGRLVQETHSLPIEYILTTTRERTPVDLAAELYGSEEEKYINAIINDNNLNGSDLLSIPAGKVIRYYR